VFVGVCCAGAVDFAGADFAGGAEDVFLFCWAKTQAGMATASESNASFLGTDRKFGRFIFTPKPRGFSLASISSFDLGRTEEFRAVGSNESSISLNFLQRPRG
jgi:hypothetical protein